MDFLMLCLCVLSLLGFSWFRFHFLIWIESCHYLLVCSWWVPIVRSWEALIWLGMRGKLRNKLQVTSFAASLKQEDIFKLKMDGNGRKFAWGYVVTLAFIWIEMKQVAHFTVANTVHGLKHKCVLAIECLIENENASSQCWWALERKSWT